MDQSDILMLVARCQDGDQQAIEILVKAYQHLVYKLALSILDDPDEAKEAAQDTFVLALRRLDTFRGEAAFKTWLYSIAINVCRGQLRRRRCRVRLTDAIKILLPNRDETSSPSSNRTAAEEERLDVIEAVGSLHEKFRVPLVLRYYHDLPIIEIAQILRVNERTVYNRLNSAHERLRYLIDQ